MENDLLSMPDSCRGGAYVICWGSEARTVVAGCLFSFRLFLIIARHAFIRTFSALQIHTYTRRFSTSTRGRARQCARPPAARRRYAHTADTPWPIRHGRSLTHTVPAARTTVHAVDRPMAAQKFPHTTPAHDFSSMQHARDFDHNASMRVTRRLSPSELWR